MLAWGPEVSVLTEAFLAAAAAGAGTGAAPPPADVAANLDAALTRAVADAGATLPEVAARLPAETFAAFLGSKLDPGESPLAALGELHLGDLYLALACREGLAPAVQRFVDEHLARVPRYVARLRPDPLLAEEVQQELAQRLLVATPPDPPRIATYNGRGPLDSWLAVAAQRTALNLIKRQQRDPQGEPADQLERALTESPDPELQLARMHLKQNFEWAMRAALRALSPRDRLLLRLTVVSGLSCRKLGVMHGVHPATAARWIERIREELFSSIGRSLQEARGIDPDELPSLLGLVRSRLELSLSGLLAPDET
jgi:RNA polymerase sigma-70 factor (ECF subfamily)